MFGGVTDAHTHTCFLSILYFCHIAIYMELHKSHDTLCKEAPLAHAYTTLW